ncbi:DUF2147 domain-containing protein [Paludibacter jiangxiensis]|uniref:DUF2147 domain-containing protein n=1 Tax=Paludibacter jiangxiensis TaxID=681398 RepID=A0A170Y6M2_9BACT|nr:DUF2147 domain-containing protein [Paludibacter jiangxiensis]GAT61561.1 hypothetical protein PJIAN_1141 [Paludibacter jiangxiensis]
MSKLYITAFVLFLSLSSSMLAQSKADRIVGYYLTYDDETGKEKSQVQIFKAANGKYYGQIVWLKVPTDNGKPKLDAKNPDKQLQTKPILGLQMLKNFVYNASKDEWSEGSIYNPANGKTYNCFMKFENASKLKIRGFIGSSWMGLGKTAYWTKEANSR